MPEISFDKIHPQDCINAKVRRLHRMLNGVYLDKFNDFGLKGSMVSILFIIGKRPGISQKFLADRLVLDQSTISRDLKKLQGKGLIQMGRSVDSRQSEIDLSESGKELIEKLAPIWSDLHSRFESMLGQYLITQLDVITEAVSFGLEELDKS